MYLNYQTATCDEGGGITNVDESATDNDLDFKSLLRGLNCPMPPPNHPDFGKSYRALKHNLSNTSRVSGLHFGKCRRPDDLGEQPSISQISGIDRSLDLPEGMMDAPSQFELSDSNSQAAFFRSVNHGPKAACRASSVSLMAGPL
mmetsp:Transcript_36218/g.55614  ORF Transcript_36218/g.55614 Transcript_36218/m.55614 type:complete len:145 (-) Transcript_36218:235-669(-)